MRVHTTALRLLVLLLYAVDHPAISVYGSTDRAKRLLVMVGPLARELRISNGAFLDQLEWLETQGYLQLHRKPRPGLVDLSVLLPPGAVWTEV